MRAFGYVRLSRLDETTTSPARQREVIADLCRSRGWELVDVFEDLDVSGGRESREGLDAMLARLDETDAVVLWKLDRLARSLSHLLKLVDRFEEAGVQLVTSDGEVDTTTAGGRAFFQMRGVFAEFERRTVIERTRGAHAYLKAQGKAQSRTPFGFRKDAENRFERDPETWPRLVAILERVAAGESFRSIGRDLEIPHTTIRVYARSRKAVDSLEVDRPDLAAALRARLTSVSFHPGPRSLLAGLARCGTCRSALRVSQRNAGQVAYGCRDGGHVYVDRDWLDELVVRDVLRFAPWTTPTRQADETPSEDRAQVERLLRELEDDRDAGLVARERFVERRAALLGRLGRADVGDAPRPILERVAWDDLEPAARRLALREVLVAVEVSPLGRGSQRRAEHPERVVLVWR